MKVETQDEADRLNREGVTEPYWAANGHLMIASVELPSERDAAGNRHERPYRVGDDVRYVSWSAWCAPGCSHRELGPLPDW